MRAYALLLVLAPAMIHAQKLLIADIATNGKTIAFTYAGQLWTVPATGGQAKKLFADDNQQTQPMYSPDGSQIAFTLNGNDIYVAPAAGGEAERITYHPKADTVRCWTPDGKAMIFSSFRENDSLTELYRITVGGSLEERLPIPRGMQAAISPDGKSLIYVPDTIFFGTIRRRFYRGGDTGYLRSYDMASGASAELTLPTHNAIFPNWIGDKVFYLSDSKGSFNLAELDPKTKASRELTDYVMKGVTAVGAGGGLVALVHDGEIETYDIASRKLAKVPVQVDPADLGALNERKAKTVNADRYLQSYTLSQDGARAAIESRGNILIADLGSGSIQSVTDTAGAAERIPMLSPDGKSVAYFSDTSGEYELHVRDLATNAVKTYTVEKDPTFYNETTWSPNGSKIAFSDTRLNLFSIDIGTGKVTLVDTSKHMAQGPYYPAWSPDGRWLAYSKALPNRVRTVFLWDSQSGKSHQITDGTVHAQFPVFDRSGRYLYFSGSHTARNASASDVGWGLFSSMLWEPLVSKKLCIAVLSASEPAPLNLTLGNTTPGWSADSKSNQVDSAGIENRIVSVPFQKNIAGLLPGPAGTVVLQVEASADTPGAAESPTYPLYLFDIAAPRQPKKLVDNAPSYAVSGDGSKILYSEDGKLSHLATRGEGKPVPLDLATAKINVDPVQEWKQIYREAWRMMRDYFYDPNYHGQDVGELERHYAAYLPQIARRNDLNALLQMAFGEISISHLRVGGGDLGRGPQPAPSVGMLGADYEIADGKYRFKRVLENGPYMSDNTLLRAPLDQPTIRVKPGDFLLEVDGVAVDSSKSIYSYFAGKANRQVKIKVAASADGSAAREYTVVPSNGENGLRVANWVEDNRRKVEKLSKGRLAYVFINGWGLEAFAELSRVLSGHSDKDGLIIDQRGNPGGITPDFIVEALTRTPMLAYGYRNGADFVVPTNRIDGPKVLMIDQGNGSAAETGALMFKAMKLGTIVGTRTWGGGVGAALFQQTLVDNGSISIPNRAGHNPISGEWEIENEGVRPHVVVDIVPEDYRAGRDPQLEAAVAVALKELATYKKPKLRKPKPPVHAGGKGGR